MDYITLFKERHIEANENYPRNDIGIAKLFYDLHSAAICYVRESKMWFTYGGKMWEKDEGGLKVMELCKRFVQSLANYAAMLDDGSDESKAYTKYTAGFHTRRKREGLLSDARSIAPKSITVFDRDKLIFNCQNGTLSLNDMALRPHAPTDYLTKISPAEYRVGASCERWERFIGEVMSGDTDTARFLQKAFGYCLSGETALECFFILYGKTRTGKTTLSETVAHVLGDYAKTIQPQTLARRPSDGSAASPDVARLKGARLVNVPEPEKGLELNIALVKQLTGGDTYTGRFLNENPFEFRPEFKIFINTNHLPRTDDDTIFSSERVKLIPFDRRFMPKEQDNGLKCLFREPENMSGILNWLIAGYRLLQAEGLSIPEKVKAAIIEYQQGADIIGHFLCECTATHNKNRLPTTELYAAYTRWARDNGYKPMNKTDFLEVMRCRLDIRRGGVGYVAVGLVLDCHQTQ